MFKMYEIINKNTGHIYIGRTGNDDQWERHKKLLRENRHFNKLLQQHWNDNYEFDFKVIYESDDPIEVARKTISLIRDIDSINPIKGYNTFFDSQGLEHSKAKLDLYDEDIAFLYLEHDTDALKEMGLTNHTLEYRLRRIGLGGKRKIPISTYDCLYHYCALEAVLSSYPLISSRLLDRCVLRYDVSRKMRITSRKVAAHLKAMNIPSVFKNGSTYFGGDLEN